MAIQKGDDYWEANCLAAMHRLNKNNGGVSISKSGKYVIVLFTVI